VKRPPWMPREPGAHLGVLEKRHTAP
jgi:hypothetical protein